MYLSDSKIYLAKFRLLFEKIHLASSIKNRCLFIRQTKSIRKRDVESIEVFFCNVIQIVENGRRISNDR